MKVKVEIEIPDGYELVDEKMRPPKMGERYITSDGEVAEATSDWPDERYNHRAIIRKSWWPKWLTADWVTVDLNGDVYAWKGCDPCVSERLSQWMRKDSDQGSHMNLTLLVAKGLVDIDLPTAADWTKAKWPSPHKKD